jgi:uncharacterized protein (DUF58 family)
MAKLARGRTPELPCPSVRFDADFVSRLERFAERLAAARDRREDGGGSAAAGGGHEFVGYRPYRPGEDLRALDWSLLARLDRPYVRVTQREAGERWLVLLDTSASMGVGPPGKLQRAAEVCAAIASLGLRLAAEVRVLDAHSGEAGGRRSASTMKKRSNLAEFLAFLEARVAGAHVAEDALDPFAALRDEAARIFVISDFLSTSPEHVLPLARAGRELFLVQLLAPIELDPKIEGAIEWWEPESGGRLALSVDERLCASYAIELERRLDAWRTAADERGARHSCSSTALAFEDVLGRALRAGSP